MVRKRIIPVLLLKGEGLVKGSQFKSHKYVGDPINAVKIFNEKEVDELVFLDIAATKTGKVPNYELIKSIASEAFMPFAYGGGVKTLNDVEKLFYLGVEKVVINSAAFYNPDFVRQAASIAGSQSIIVCIDVKTNIWGKQYVYVNNGTFNTKQEPTEYALKMQDIGAGEIILSSIDREGSGEGYDIPLVEGVSRDLSIPLVAVGGAGSVDHFYDLFSRTEVTAAAAGDLFVFHGKHKAVLISYPDTNLIDKLCDPGSGLKRKKIK